MLKCQNLMRVSDENESMTVWNYTGDLKDESNKYRGGTFTTAPACMVMVTLLMCSVTLNAFCLL